MSLGIAAAAAGLALGCATPRADTQPAADPGAPVVVSQERAAPPSVSAAQDDDALVASISEGPSDPLEPINRGFFFLNRGVDAVLLDPITDLYAFLVPDPGRLAVRRVFDNLNSAQIFVNDLLQLQFEDAAVTAARFAINTTLGLGGILDPAERLGLERHESDFGETLARVGIGPGFYLMLPLLGPSTVRDSVGDGVDGFMLPQAWILGFGSRLLLDGGDGLSLRERHQEELGALRDSSVDFYAALRSAFWFDREGALRARLERSKEGAWAFHIVEPSRSETGSEVSAPASVPPSTPVAEAVLEALRVVPTVPTVRAVSAEPAQGGPRAALAP